MLSKLRVLEISSPETMLAGQLLADLGADVIVVEPPAGSAARRLEPFVDDLPGLERSLVWLAYNRNKRGITLDLRQPDGRALLSQLSERCDVLLEAAHGGDAPVEILPQAGSRLVRCVIRPFSGGSAKACYRSSDLIVTAAAGALGNMGDRDRPPTPFPVPQAMLEASGEAAVGILAALLARADGSGEQLLEISARLASLFSSFGQPIWLAAGNREGERTGGVIRIGDVEMPPVYACRDGFAAVTVAFGPGFGTLTGSLARWLGEQGQITESVASTDWVSYPLDLLSGRADLASLRELVTGIEQLCAQLTKQEIARAGRERGLLMAPVMEMGDIAESRQHAERGLWEEMELPVEGRRVKVPLRFAQFSDYSIEIRRPPPSLSQHTSALLEQELALSRDEIQALFVHGII